MKKSRFNGKFRDECLSVEWFRNRLEVKVAIKESPLKYS
jgi:putative transposase